MEEREQQQQESSFSSSETSNTEAAIPAQWRMERQADAEEKWFNDDDAEVIFIRELVFFQRLATSQYF